MLSNEWLCANASISVPWTCCKLPVSIQCSRLSYSWTWWHSLKTTACGPTLPHLLCRHCWKVSCHRTQKLWATKRHKLINVIRNRNGFWLAIWNGRACEVWLNSTKNRALSRSRTTTPSPCYPCRHRKFLNAIMSPCTVIALFLEVIGK